MMRIPTTARYATTAILLLCIVLLAQPALALRASPAQVIIPQGSDGAFTIRVLDAQDPALVTAIVTGDLATHVLLDALTAHPDGGVAISGHLAIPDTATPGDHQQDLIISVATPDAKGTVAARAELAIPLIARIPYPDKYLVVNWDAQPDPGSAATHITVTLENRGRVLVTTAPLDIRFTDGATELPSLPLPALTIAPGAFGRDAATYVLPQDAIPGVYDATLTVPYAGIALTSANPVTLGVPRLSIDGVLYDVAETGVIVPVDVDGTVAWNRPLTLDIAVYFDGSSTPAAIGRTTTAQRAFHQRLYVDTAQTARANATVRAVVTAGEVAAERTVHVTPRPADRSSSMLLLLVGVALLVCAILAIAVFVLWRRRSPPTV